MKWLERIGFRVRRWLRGFLGVDAMHAELVRLRQEIERLGTGLGMPPVAAATPALCGCGHESVHRIDTGQGWVCPACHETTRRRVDEQYRGYA